MKTKIFRPPVIIDVPEGLCVFEGFARFLPVPRAKDQILYLSRAGKFPPYARYLGNSSPAFWKKTELLAFWEEKFSEDWPKHVEAMRKAFGKQAKIVCGKGKGDADAP